MLVLTRRPNQSIIIGEDIEVTVVEVKGEQVRLGITAPKEIPIYRREIYEKIPDASKAGGSARATPAFTQPGSSVGGE